MRLYQHGGGLYVADLEKIMVAQHHYKGFELNWDEEKQAFAITLERVSEFLCNRLMSDTVAPNRRHHEQDAISHH